MEGTAMASDNMNALPENCWKTIGTFGDMSCSRLDEYIHCRNCRVYAQAGRQLLERPVPGRFVDEWTELLAQPTEHEDLDTFSVLVFRLVTDWMAIRTGSFHEAVQVRPVHSVPFRSGKIFLGLVNINGELLPCFSVVALMGMETVAPEEHHKTACERMVVVSTELGRMVFVVDEIDGIHHVPPEQVQKPPATFSKSQSAYTSGIFTHKERIVGLIDDERLFASMRGSVAQ
jgi:chemotaxis-related protein WspD